MEFYPEGHRIETTQNRLRTASLFALAEAAKSQDILEGKAVVCDAAHNLIVELGEGLRGIIPREEGALGIREGHHPRHRYHLAGQQAGLLCGHRL